ncbi:MAG: tRNA preQ1(34) S-adenosylmethionine ribosyltransferase-isomerase QueA [Spirochaetaceae bacterium]|jgi:S-adenosylmethionine:tRNA ribosyltransferase-isomerase|nr:tRNA preQ1(34) S-adenosylmethionine ribosyltransferase-isomerase QueA [Spirochaetaceae bacterium]
MKTADFSFDLPKRLISQVPPAERGTSRLMLLNRQERSIGHYRIGDLPRLIPEGSVMVFNNSRVRKARLIGTAEAGGAKAEFLLLNPEADGLTWKTITQRTKRKRIGNRYCFAGEMIGEITGSAGMYRFLRFDRPVDDSWLDRYGHIPLPPYIQRGDTRQDAERYQTVYAETIGSAAAPTAGLHFTQELLRALREQGIEIVFVTLHVGLGTFLPVRTEHIEAHNMHEERFFIDASAAKRISDAKACGRAVIPVGTTSARTLESAWRDGGLCSGEGSTSIFIYPGYEFKVIDGLFTNFHTPESTLLMLVCAFGGRDFIMESYRDAVQAEYRFFSYGDAMLIL